MRTPDFKASDRFLFNTKLPCLVAKIRNSEIPGLGERFIAETRRDPVCTIYLRCKQAGKISSWHQKMLQNLLEKNGLTGAVVEGMKEFQKTAGSEVYDEFDEKQRRQIEKVGLVPYLFINSVIVDDVDEKVLIGADSSLDILHEHGSAFYLNKGRWRFKEGDYLNNYVAKVTAPREKDEAERWQAQWESVFPVSNGDSADESDLSPIFGVWSFSRTETVKALERCGLPKTEIMAEITPMSLAAGYYFTKGAVERLYQGETSLRCKVLKYGREGNLFTIRVRVPPDQDWHFWCDGKLLVSRWGKRVFRRAKTSYRKGG